MFGYTSKRPGVIITHVINFTKEEMKEMDDHSHCYTSNKETDASFCHLTETEYNEFIDIFGVELVDTRSELQFLKKIII